MVVEKHIEQQPGIVDLFKMLINDFFALLTQHIELFRQEIKDDVELAAKYTSIAIAGALIAYTSLIFFGFFLIFALALFMPLWLSSLFVTIFYFVIAIVSLLIAKKRLEKLKKEPDETVDEAKKTVKEAKKWLHDLK